MKPTYKPWLRLSYTFVFLILITNLFSCKTNSSTKEDEEENRPEKLEIEKRFGIAITQYNITENTVEPNEPFSTILQKQGLPYTKVLESIEASTGIINLRHIRQGNNYFVFQKNDSTSTTDYLIYQLSITKYVKFDFRDSVKISAHELPVHCDTVSASGSISSSLWVSLKNAGMDPRLALELSDIYAWTIDFYGLQKGDSFNLVFEKESIDSIYVGIGKVLACHFIHAGHNYQAYLYSQDSLEDYFDEEGGSLRRAFLKAPLKFGRISSHFSNSRLHPVLKIRRPHHGVDYAAPTGTPILTIGDGKVTFVGRKGGYGNRVEIKHNSTYSTGYAHLSKYAKGLKAGDFVKQGTIIGYVGATGLATGPHLDFRVYKNGTPIDPLKMESPPAIPINDANKSAFAEKIIYWNNKLGE